MFQSFIPKNRSEYYLVPIYFSTNTSRCSINFFGRFSMFQSFISNNIIRNFRVVTGLVAVTGKVCVIVIHGNDVYIARELA